MTTLEPVLHTEHPVYTEEFLAAVCEAYTSQAATGEIDINALVATVADQDYVAAESLGAALGTVPDPSDVLAELSSIGPQASWALHMELVAAQSDSAASPADPHDPSEVPEDGFAEGDLAALFAELDADTDGDAEFEAAVAEAIADSPGFIALDATQIAAFMDAAIAGAAAELPLASAAEDGFAEGDLAALFAELDEDTEGDAELDVAVAEAVASDPGLVTLDATQLAALMDAAISE